MLGMIGLGFALVLTPANLSELSNNDHATALVQYAQVDPDMQARMDRKAERRHRQTREAIRAEMERRRELTEKRRAEREQKTRELATLNKSNEAVDGKRLAPETPNSNDMSSVVCPDGTNLQADMTCLIVGDFIIAE